MSQGLIGQLACFDEETEDFANYIEQLEQYFSANDIANAKRVAVFISSIGSKTYKLLRNLLQPTLPKDCTYEVLVKTLQDHFKPAPIIIAERFRFHRRNQKVGESISSYLVELKMLASTCSFGDFLNEAIRDRFVCGISSETIQRRLLAKKDLKLSTAMEFALAMEIADSDANNMKVTYPVINKVQRSKAAVVNRDTKFFGKKKCFRCGAPHDANKCKFKNATCHSCSKIGHISPVCMSKRNGSTKKIEASSEQPEYSLFTVQTDNKVSKYTVPVVINGKATVMELDTAADVSLVSEQWINENFQNINLQPSSIRLRDYNQAMIELLGEIQVQVLCNSQLHTVPLVIVKGNRPALFGKNWLSKFKLNWNKIFAVDVVREKGMTVDVLKREYSDLFQESTSPIKHFKARLKMKIGCTPVFCKARPVPYAIKQKVAEEIEKTRNRGVWDFVEHSEWATPIVVVPKKNNAIRLCGDYKITANKHLDPNQYPLPTQQDLFSTLNGGQFFTKLDLSHAYQQVSLDEDSQEYLTLNTHLGLVRPRRLLYGITCASSVFQSIIEQIVQGLPSVVCFQDDILVSGSTHQDHISNLSAVFERLRKYNVSLNANKCEFAKKSIEFLGHIIDAQGIHPTDEKIQSIIRICPPTNVTELKSFLGILNYYSKFIKNASMVLAPLYELLHADVPWNWTIKCDETFQKCKRLLTSSAVLVHYDEKLPIRLSCDASPLGLGVVLSHIVKDEEHPVAYASRTLSRAEKNYSQLEKEAAAIVFGIKKFHQYIYGRKFTIVTDHKPLISIFGVDRAVPTLAAARLQRWAILLASFQYSIEYRRGIEHTNADALSRAPIGGEDATEVDILKVSYSDDLPVNCFDIALATRNDAVLGLAIKYVRNGWPEGMDNVDLKPFFSRKEELSVDNDCLLWGMRVIIPSKYRNRLLEQLHDIHSGMCKMKAIARSHIWWPNLDRDIEDMVRQRSACQRNSKNPPGTPLQPWNWCKYPMDRVHIDFAQKDQKTYMLLVDSHSKWLEVVHMPSTTAVNTIEALQQIFSRYGLPLELVSDNGPQLISGEFKFFLRSNGIRHTLIPAYHPQSNGLAERNVQTFKDALNKMNSDARDRDSTSRKILRFLMSYRSTPHSTTGVSPAELFLSRTIRTPLALVHPTTLAARVQHNQQKQKKYYDRSHTTNRSFAMGQKVFVRSHRDQKWSNGVLVGPKGDNTWIVEVDCNRYLAHVDQMRENSLVGHDSMQNAIKDDDWVESMIESRTMGDFPTEDGNVVSPPQEQIPSTVLSGNETEIQPSPSNSLLEEANPQPAPFRRNPVRNRRKPLRLDL